MDRLDDRVRRRRQEAVDVVALSRHADRAARHHVPHWLFAALAVALLVVLLNLAIVLLSAPVIEWIGKAPQLAATIRNKLQILERPTAALHDLQNVIPRRLGAESGLGIN